MTTVTRSEIIDGTTLEITSRAPNGSLHSTVYSVLPDFVRYEEEMTPNSNEPHSRRWKDFEHRKAFRSVQTGMRHQAVIMDERSGFAGIEHTTTFVDHPRFACTGYTTQGAPYNPLGEPGLPLDGLPDFVVRRPDGGFVPPPENLHELEARAMRSMLPAIKEELSVLNSLYELKDFKTLPRTLARLKTTAVSAWKRHRGTLRRILQGSSDGYLQASFNILPLLSDISGIHSALTRTEARINELLTRAGKPQVRHFNWTWHEHKDIEDVSDNYYCTPLSEWNYQFTVGQLRRRCVHDASVFHAMMQYNYNYTAYQIEHARLLGYLDAFGVNLNPSIIWNAIPWSFVVDWVFSVGKYLDDFKVQNMKPQTNIRQYLWSIRRKRRVYTWKKVYNNTTLSWFGYPVPVNSREVLLPVTEESTYRRSVGLPSTSSISSSGLTLKEISLAAALVLPRAWRPRKRRY